MTEAEKRRLREQGLNPDTAANPFTGPATGLATLPRPAPVTAAPPPGSRLSNNSSPSNPRYFNPATRQYSEPTPAAPVNYGEYPEPGSAAPSGADESAIAPLINEKARRSAHISPADYYHTSGALNTAPSKPFDSGFFNQRPAAQPALATLPRTPQAPVGGTTAVVNPNPVRPLNTPYGSGTVNTAPVAAGTRKPFIAGADGVNVAQDFVAGGRFSSAKAGSDTSLDQQYVRGLPRKRKQEALFASG